MPAPAWFNANENRDYPFVPGAGVPPRALVVDAGFAPGAKSRYETGTHAVRLVAVRRAGAVFYLDFEADAPELFGVPLTFRREAADGDFVTEFLDSGTAGLSASSDSASTSGYAGECDEPLWEGFVVTGRAAAFEALLPGDGVVSFSAAVEPALVQNLAEAYVSRVAVANLDRTHATSPDGCDEENPVDEGAVYVAAPCLTGDVVLVPGFNALVRQAASDNAIVLGAAVGAGEGEPCAPVPVRPGEEPPPGSTLLGGGPRCNETVRSVNGVGGPQLTLLAGRGVTIAAVPEENRLVVTVDMGGLAGCPASVSARSESC